MHVLVTVALICLVPVLTVGWVIAALDAFVGITLAVAFAAEFHHRRKRAGEGLRPHDYGTARELPDAQS